MSALPIKADMFSVGTDVRYVPKADASRRHSARQRRTLSLLDSKASSPLVWSV